MPLSKPLLPECFLHWTEPAGTDGDETFRLVTWRRSLTLKGKSFREFEARVFPLLDGTRGIGEICDALEHLSSRHLEGIPWKERIEFYQRASHCYGRSALMLSGGGTLGGAQTYLAAARELGACHAFQKPIPRDEFLAAGSDTVQQPEIGAFSGHPLRSVRAVLDIWHALLH